MNLTIKTRSPTQAQNIHPKQTSFPNYVQITILNH